MQRLKYWLPTLGWMAVIFAFSGRAAITASEVSWQDFVIKKTAHVVEYGVLSCLFFYSLRHTTGWSKKKMIFWGTLAAMMYAVSDEWHQSFVPGRTARLRDVVIDGCGVLAGQWLIYNYFNVRNTSSLASPPPHQQPAG